MVPEKPGSQILKKILAENMVRISCDNTEREHPDMNYGILEGYAVSSVYGNQSEGYKVDVTINPAAYIEQYNQDCGEEHVLSGMPAVQSITLEYEGNGWTVRAGETPIPISVICENTGGVDPGEDDNPPETDPGEDNNPPEADPGEDDNPPEADPGEDDNPPEADPGEDNNPPEADSEEDDNQLNSEYAESQDTGENDSGTEESRQSTAVHTGDSSTAGMWSLICLIILSGTTALAAGWKRIRRKQKN